MTKTYSRLLTAVFALFLGGFLIWHIAQPDRDRSEMENRTLAQRPTLSWETVKSGSYMKDMETYFTDQFPLRDGWTGAKARMEQMLGKTLFKGVYLTGDTLISKVEPPVKEQDAKNLGYIAQLAQKTEIPVHLGLIPSAAEIWKDKIPAGAESWDQAAFLDRAAALGLPMVDIASAQETHKAEPIFYRTDHHWTTLGAFYGASALLESLGRPALNVADFTPETASDAFDGTLYSTSGVHWLPPDTIEFWVPEEGLSVTSWRSGAPAPATLYDRSYLEKKDQYSAFLGGNQPLCVIKNETLPGGGKLLLVRDSYSDALAPFLAQSFAEVHLLDLRYYRAPVAQYAAENGIDEIVVLYSIPNLITDANLVFLAQ